MSSEKQPDLSVPTCTHWGNYRVSSEEGKLTAVEPYPVDLEPTPIGQSLLDALDPGARIPQPMVRAGYLHCDDPAVSGHGKGRGNEPFVPVSWEKATALAARAPLGAT